MTEKRIALAIEISKPFRHHLTTISGIQRYVRENPGWSCVVDPYVNLDESSYDGIIARAESELIDQANARNTPLINVWSHNAALDVASVLPDYEEMGREAAKYLLQRGYLHFGYHGHLDHPGTQSAIKGFGDVLKAAGKTFAILNAGSDCDESSDKWSVYKALLEEWVTGKPSPMAVFCSHDTLSRYLAQACTNVGLRVPEDVAILGIGNEPLLCSDPEPSLSSIELCYEEIGYAAAQNLARIMSGEPVPRTSVYVNKTQIISRASTNYYIAQDPLVQNAITFIVENLHRQIRVRDVADHVNSTVRSLERHFGKELKRTMSQEIARLRLERASQLLLQSDDPIKQIAYDCGYSSRSYFHQAFVKSHGISPLEFRKQHALTS